MAEQDDQPDQTKSPIYHRLCPSILPTLSLGSSSNKNKRIAVYFDCLSLEGKTIK